MKNDDLTPAPGACTPEKRYATTIRLPSGESGFVRFNISDVDAREIIRLAALASKNGLRSVEKLDGRASWLEGDNPDDFLEIPTAQDTLNVAPDKFWFSGCLKGTNVQIQSKKHAVCKLVEWLGIQPVAEQTCASTHRVLVIVSDGVADPISDDEVDVEVFDWDNYHDDPEGTGGVPERFADLAALAGVPVGETIVATNRPKP